MSTTIKISLKDQTVTPVKYENNSEESWQESQNESHYNGESDVKNEAPFMDTSEYIEDESGFEGLDIDDNMEYELDNFEPTIAFSDHQEYEESDNLMKKNEDSNETDSDYNTFIYREGSCNSKEGSYGTDSDYNALIHREDPCNSKEDSCDSQLQNDDNNTEDDSQKIKNDNTNDLTTIDCCSDNPNFAVVMDFMEKFGDHIGLKNIPMKELEAMLCDHSDIIHPDLVHLHTVLLKRVKLSKKLIITKKSWEKGLILFCNGAGGMIYEGLEVQNLGYSQVSVSVRLELLKGLMESQFDWNELVRALVDDLPVEALRNEPTGKDIDGNIYWTQVCVIYYNFCPVKTTI